MTTRILIGDALAVLRGLPAGAFQCCVTSPPYYGLRDYGVAGQIGLEETPDAYVARLVEVFREVRRVLRPDGTLWLNIGDSYAGSWGAQGRQDETGQMASRSVISARQIAAHPRRQSRTGSTLHLAGIKPKDLFGIPWMVAFALRADGWFLRSAIVWHKPNPMPESVQDRPTSAYEHVFLLAKSERYFYDADAIREPSTGPGRSSGNKERKRGGRAGRTDGLTGNVPWSDDGTGRNARNVWTISTKPFRGAHFATMPPDLAERCIKAGTSEAGACPRCGGPWARVVERTRLRDGEPISGGWPQQNAQRLGATGVGHWRDTQETRTLGWRPSCGCPFEMPDPCRVLDPFGGAGTTALAARNLGRACTLIELNPAYAEIARERLGLPALAAEGAALDKRSLAVSLL